MSSAFAPDVALDALFRRNVAAHPDAIALDSNGDALTYMQTSNAVAHLATQIASFNLPPASSIALLLPNGNELVLALLAIIQSGHVAVPMPVAWRKSDLVRACREAETAALITTSQFESENLPELAADVAIEVFELSFPCSFGSDLPDGIVSLAISTEEQTVASVGRAATGVATLQPVSSGISFILHHDEEMLAGGLGAMLAANMQAADRIVSAVSLSNFAGLTSAFVPWLLCGGTLTLLQDIPQVIQPGSHFVAPVGIVPDLYVTSSETLASVLAVHFAGTTFSDNFDTPNAKIVDVIALNEICAIALPRARADRPASIPLGPLHAGNSGAGAPVILETQLSDTGRILVRGAMIPRTAIGADEWYDTGYKAVANTPAAFDAEPPAQMIAIGALRFSLPELERRILSAVLVSSVEAIDDPVLGNRIVISSERPEQTIQALLDAGLPRVIANAVRKAENARTRSA